MILRAVLDTFSQTSIVRGPESVFAGLTIFLLLLLLRLSFVFVSWLNVIVQLFSSIWILGLVFKLYWGPAIWSGNRAWDEGPNFAMVLLYSSQNNFVNPSRGCQFPRVNLRAYFRRSFGAVCHVVDILAQSFDVELWCK